jgi:hypothetical protein
MVGGLIPAISEGLEVNSQTQFLALSNGTLNAIQSDAFPDLTVCFSAVMIGIPFGRIP